MKMNHRWVVGIVLLGISGSAMAARGLYIYKLIANKNPDVCYHMLRVFNKNFRNLWQSPLLISDADPLYNAGSQYAFPRLPGVEHSTDATWVMRYSKVPSSPEFSAIHWVEGRETLGSCSAGENCSTSHVPLPVLVAYFDFDNDGHIDTVAKTQFYSGEGYGELGSGNDEYLIVWRNQKIDFRGTPVLWALTHQENPKNKPVTTYGKYQRPFIYKGSTYVATYSGNPLNNSTPETMSILAYEFTGRLERITQFPVWDASTVCDYSMHHDSKAH